MKKLSLTLVLALAFALTSAISQQLVLPRNGTNIPQKAGIKLGVTNIDINWNAPGVKGREGNIWGTGIAHYGFGNLGFGTAKESPWRAGADECTTIAFSTDVTVEGKKLAAGKYGFFIAVYPDSCTLIFSKNAAGWGSYFYKPEEDVLRVTVRQQKNLPQSREWLAYTFSDPTASSAIIALEWERWRIPFKVEVDVKSTGLAAIQSQMTSGLGFDPPSLIAAAQWCLNNDVNYEEGLVWINFATDPNLGGVKTFTALSTKAGLLRKLGRGNEADQTMTEALDNGSVIEIHGYGRQLITAKKYQEALAVFEKNYQKYGDTWPTHVGLARGYSAAGDLKKALEHAKTALGQAPDATNKASLESMVKTLSEGKALMQ